MQKIISGIAKLCKDQKLIEDGDKIAVGLSGGKDSLLLVKAMKRFQAFSDKKFDLIAISIDLSNGQMDYSEIEKFCKDIEVPFYKKQTNIFEIIFDIRKEKNPCSLCANMRRGVLNSYAKELGCNKVALGHHMDDLIETFVMSLFFEGRMSTFKPSTYLSRTDITVIRPMLYIEEKDVINSSKDLPVIHNVCPANHETERETAKELLQLLEQTYPDTKKRIFTAISHPERTNLWDE